jgi:hypothetical protein
MTQIKQKKAEDLQPKWNVAELRDLFYQLRTMFLDVETRTYTKHISIVEFQAALKNLKGKNKRGESHD